MKIGVLSDIHAYLASFRKALNIFEDHQVDTIICAGDLVDGGEDGDDVVDLIRSMNIPCVLGNHDRDIFTDQAWIRRKMRETGETTHPYLLTSKTTAYVSTLPVKHELKFDGTTLCLAHGVPWSNTTYLFPDMDDHYFQKVVNTTNADIFVLGHTHMPMCIHIGKKRIINSGSTYSNRFDEKQTCGILHLPDFTFEVFDLEGGKPIQLEVRNIVAE